MTKSLSLATILGRLADRTINDASVGFRTMVEIAALSPEEDFIGASLQGLDFRDEDLRGFNFSRANLTGADFRRADIRGVSFDGAILTGAIGLDGKQLHKEKIVELPPPDFDIRKVKELILGDDTIPEDWIPFVVELDFSNEPLRNLEPLASLINLHHLDLTKTLVENIAPLRNLTQLRELGLGDTKVSDISALQTLKQLQTLDLTSTKVENLNVLTEMHQLKLLFLLNSSVTELDSISVIPGLCVVGSSALLHPRYSAVDHSAA